MAFTLLLTLFVLAFASIASGIVLWKSNKRTDPMSHMGCGDCGYSVQGLEGWQCPECGADLRQAGIWPKRTPTARLTGILLFCSGGSLLVGLLLIALLTVQTRHPYSPPGPAAPPPPSSGPNTNPF